MCLHMDVGVRPYSNTSAGTLNYRILFRKWNIGALYNLQFLLNLKWLCKPIGLRQVTTFLCMTVCTNGIITIINVFETETPQVVAYITFIRKSLTVYIKTWH